MNKNNSSPTLKERLLKIYPFKKIIYYVLKIYIHYAWYIVGLVAAIGHLIYQFYIGDLSIIKIRLSIIPFIFGQIIMKLIFVILFGYFYLIPGLPIIIFSRNYD